MALAPGTRIGPYEVTAQIGAGGMGEVYRARDLNLGRDVAIKVVLDSFAQDPERLARFEREAKTLAALNHPNIAIIHGLENSDTGRALVMEYIAGETLADRIARGPIPVAEAMPTARQIAEALEAAHEQGIVHRDLKPANVKVRPDGAVKVLDFGLAKALEPAGPLPAGVTQSPTITSPPVMSGAGMLLGTAAYMSPEQARGRPADKRADIWAFGCVLYEMLTGRRAFDGEDVSEVLASVLAREPDWSLLPPDVSPMLATFLKRCVHKDRKQRIADAQTVRLALDGAFDITSPQQAPPPPTVPRPFWRGAMPIVATALIAVVVTSVAAWMWRPRPTTQVINRFDYDVPADQSFRSDGRPVLALSPDGRHFVYNTAAGLYIRSMGTLDARPIPGTEGGPGGANTTAALAGPFFAPDGESIGYFEGGQLKRIRTSGGAPFVICAALPSLGATWAADDTILFGQPAGIMRVSANGGTPQLVIPAKKGELLFGPQLLPAGDLVLFTATTSAGPTRWATGQIVVQSMASGARTVLLEGGSDARYVPTGHLIYALGEALFALPFDLERRTVTGRAVSVVDGIVPARDQVAQTPAANYAVSETGTLVYLSGASLEGARTPATLVWVDRKGREEPLGTPSRAYNNPRLSPDNTQVALETLSDVWIWDMRRRMLAPFTSHASLDLLPVWYPDGRRLAWGSNRGGPLSNIYSQVTDGSGPIERLTDSPKSQRPSSVSADGKQLFFAEAAPGAGGAQLGMIRLQGDRSVTWLLKTDGTAINPELSADGRWLAYESGELGQRQVFVRPFPEVDQRRWQVSTAGGREPLWARSGREIFYLTPEGSLVTVAVELGRDSTTFAAGTPVPLIAAGGYYVQRSFHGGRTYDVSSDGTRFLRIKEDESGVIRSSAPRRVVIVQNWFEELKQMTPSS